MILDRRFCSIVLSCVVEPSLAACIARLKVRLKAKGINSSTKLSEHFYSDPEMAAYINEMHPRNRRWLLTGNVDEKKILTLAEFNEFVGWFSLAYRRYIK